MNCGGNKVHYNKYTVKSDEVTLQNKLREPLTSNLQSKVDQSFKLVKLFSSLKLNPIVFFTR